MKQRPRLHLKFLKRKLAEYEEIKHQIKDAVNEAEKDDSIDFPPADLIQQLEKFSS